MAVVIPDVLHGLALDASWYNLVGNAVEAHDAAIASLGVRPAAILTRSTTQSIPNATETPIQFTGEEHDNANMANVATSNTNIVCPRNGVYLATGFAAMVATTVGQLIVSLALNGSMISQSEYQETSGQDAGTVAVVRYCTAGQIWTARVHHENGAAINLSVARFGVVLLSEMS